MNVLDENIILRERYGMRMLLFTSHIRIRSFFNLEKNFNIFAISPVNSDRLNYLFITKMKLPFYLKQSVNPEVKFSHLRFEIFHSDTKFEML